jgi:hypothetical protein
MIKHIYEHLKTKKKYNTLQLKYECKCEELERKILELDTQKKINRTEREMFEKAIENYVELLAKEKEKNKKKRNKEKVAK